VLNILSHKNYTSECENGMNIISIKVQLKLFEN